MKIILNRDRRLPTVARGIGVVLGHEICTGSCPLGLCRVKDEHQAEVNERPGLLARNNSLVECSKGLRSSSCWAGWEGLKAPLSLRLDPVARKEV